MNERENFLRALEFRTPQWIPITVSILPAAWMKYRESLEDIVLSHPKIFGSYAKGKKNFDECPIRYRKGYHKDNWGCLWHTVQHGLLGRIVEHPLADWGSFKTYKPPDYLTKSEIGDQDWNETETDIRKKKANGVLTSGSGGELFTRLYFLRGFENLMFDIATDNPNLTALIDMLTEYEVGLVSEWLKLGVDIVGFHTDIGAQNSLMISPEKFRRYLKPMFKRIFTICREAGAHVSLSSDGRLLEIIDDLIECGVSLHDPQVRPNTIEGISEKYNGRLCAKVDLDQQKILPFGTTEEVDSHLKEVVEKLNSPAGGLMIYAEIQQIYPLANIEALFQALEKYCLTGMD